MEWVLSPASWIALLFDKEGDSPLRKVLELERIEDLDPRELLCCSACRQKITAESARIEIGGSHGHRFTNPAGVEYHIGCFSAVWNCNEVGAPTGEHSWFAGFRWRIASCAFCGQHLGWSFSRGVERFYGLILARLVSNAGAGD